MEIEEMIVFTLKYNVEIKKHEDGGFIGFIKKPAMHAIGETEDEVRSKLHDSLTYFIKKFGTDGIPKDINTEY